MTGGRFGSGAGGSDTICRRPNCLHRTNAPNGETDWNQAPRGNKQKQGKGIIKLSNIKIQYHKKKKKMVHHFFYLFTIVRYCRHSPPSL